MDFLGMECTLVALQGPRLRKVQLAWLALEGSDAGVAALVQNKVRTLVEDFAAVFEETLVESAISLGLLVLLNVPLAKSIVDLVHAQTFLRYVHGRR